MQTLIRGAQVYRDGVFTASDILIDDGIVVSVARSTSGSGADTSASREVLEFHNSVIIPGLVDVHVHLREPGFSYKEDIASGSRAAAAGGYTDVCAMPNLEPSPDSPEGLGVQLDAIRESAVINVHPFGCITRGSKGAELAAMEELAESVAGFSDDGTGVVPDEMMLAAMEKAKSLGKLISAHCEYKSLKGGDHVNAGPAADALGITGISNESEWRMIERDIKLAERTGASYHVCHVSTKESVRLIRQAKAAGIDITCETAPHYVLLDDTVFTEKRETEGKLPRAYYKMNPPLRRPEDREEVVKGLLDGTIDMIATDHAPHSWEEKHRPIEKSPMGVVGLECAFPVMYTGMVLTGRMSLEKLVELMSTAPAARFGIKSGIEPGSPANFCIYDLDEEYVIDPESFESKGRATPFAGTRVHGRCLATWCNGEQVYSRE